MKWIDVQWSAPKTVKAMTTTRFGGFSQGRYQGLNLGAHVDDERSAVVKNRALLKRTIGAELEPFWLNQTHSTTIVSADEINRNAGLVNADGSFTTNDRLVCAVLTADCLPVFLSDAKGRCVGVFHAGWRGLADGILIKAVAAMRAHSQELIAAIGPAISQDSFEVGSEVREQFVKQSFANEQFFRHSDRHGYYMADLYGIAAAQLVDQGVVEVSVDKSICTFKDASNFYSYRRDGQTGRMASLIWIHR